MSVTDNAFYETRRLHVTTMLTNDEHNLYVKHYWKYSTSIYNTSNVHHATTSTIQVQMFCRSGTDGRCCMSATDALCELTRWQHCVAWNDFLATTLKVWRQRPCSVHWHVTAPYKLSCYYYYHYIGNPTDLRNNPAKFHPDLIWNDGTIGFSEEVASTRTRIS